MGKMTLARIPIKVDLISGLPTEIDLIGEEEFIHSLNHEGVPFKCH